MVGVKGVFSGDRLSSVGITCALCHSTVDNSLTFGIGRRLDGWANHDLDVGKIVALAPDLSPFVELLKSAPGSEQITQQDVRKVLRAWGPGKFDAELILDGKGFRPDGATAATRIPNAFDMAGFNLHTWTGAWGSVPYWNAFVAVLEMHGVGNFFDPRLDDTAQFPDIASRFPVAVANKLGHVTVDPDKDQVTSKLPACISINWHYLRPNRKRGLISTGILPSAGMSCSAARRSVPTATRSLYGQSLDGMRTGLRTSA